MRTMPTFEASGICRCAVEKRSGSLRRRARTGLRLRRGPGSRSAPREQACSPLAAEGFSCTPSGSVTRRVRTSASPSRRVRGCPAGAACTSTFRPVGVLAAWSVPRLVCFGRFRAGRVSAGRTAAVRSLQRRERGARAGALQREDFAGFAGERLERPGLSFDGGAQRAARTRWAASGTRSGCGWASGCRALSSLHGRRRRHSQPREGSWLGSPGMPQIVTSLRSICAACGCVADAHADAVVAAGAHGGVEHDGHVVDLEPEARGLAVAGFEVPQRHGARDVPNAQRFGRRVTTATPIAVSGLHALVCATQNA